MLELILSALGGIFRAIAEAALELLLFVTISPPKRRLRAARLRVRRLGKAGDWAGIGQEFNDAMAAGTSSRLPSVVIDEIPKRGAAPLASVIARALRVSDPLTLMPAARLAPYTGGAEEVHRELVALRDSGDPRLKAVADYALSRWQRASSAA